MTAAPSLFQRLLRVSLVTQIVIGLVAGILLALLSPSAALSTAFIGKVFVSALKAVAPILVFVLVMASIANHKHGQETHIRPILFLYLLGTFSAAVVAVIASTLFPSNLVLATHDVAISAPGGIGEVMQSLLLSVVDNPVSALMNANFIGILAWAIGMGIAIRHAGETTRTVLDDLSNGVTLIVRVVIRFAPLGIFGLVASTLAASGFDALLGYAHLLLVLIGCMLFVALVINPAIVFWKLRRNPYPLVLLCLRESGITAFYPQFGGQHPGQPGIERASGPARRHLFGFDPTGGDHQHGRRRHHHHRADPGCRAYPGHRRRPADRGVVECGCRDLRLWRVGCGWGRCC